MEWHRLEKCIISGCSVSLFSLALNMLVKSAKVECRGPLSRSGTRQPPIRAFMDDLTVTTTSVPGCRWILQWLMTWARMSFKPTTSRSLVLRKGKGNDRIRSASSIQQFGRGVQGHLSQRSPALQRRHTQVAVERTEARLRSGLGRSPKKSSSTLTWWLSVEGMGGRPGVSQIKLAAGALQFSLYIWS